MTRGLLAVVGAFFIWGLFPLYWKQIDDVPALQIMAHRVVWCFFFVSVYMLLRFGRAWLMPIIRQPKTMLLLVCSSLLIAINWWLYIWGVNNNHIVETSLGYFINPLVNVLLGVVVLKERLRWLQWLAVLMAIVGTGYMTWKFGRPPWIAIVLALSFGTYGFLRKIASVDSLPGLAVESILLMPLLLAYLIWAETQGVGAFGHSDLKTNLMLAGGGILTAIPLAWFAFGARIIPYSTVGILQFIGPSLQLVCGVYVFSEPFTHTHLVGFSFIWLALALYVVDGVLRRPRRRAKPLSSAI